MSVESRMVASKKVKSQVSEGVKCVVRMKEEGLGTEEILTTDNYTFIPT